MTAIRLPAWLSRGIVIVGVLDSPIMLFAELVVRGIGIRIAAEPELFDERFALLVVAQVLEGFPLVFGNDVGDVLIQPGLVGTLQFLPDCLLRLELLLICFFTLEGIRFLTLTRGWPVLQGGVRCLLSVYPANCE